MPPIKPFILLTGLTRPEHTSSIRAAAERLTSRRALVGGIIGAEAFGAPAGKHPKRLVSASDLQHVFSADPKVGGIVVYEGPATKNFAQRLEDAYQLGGQHCEGVLAAVPWPEPSDILRFRQDHSEASVLLDLYPAAFARIKGDADELVRRLRTYEGVVDAAVLNPHQTLLPTQFIGYVRAIRRAGVDIHLVAGGGLTINRLPDLKPVLRECPDLSLVVCGGIRNSLDELVPGLAAAFLLEGDRLCAKYADSDLT